MKSLWGFKNVFIITVFKAVLLFFVGGIRNNTIKIWQHCDTLEQIIIHQILFLVKHFRTPIMLLPFHT